MSNMDTSVRVTTAGAGLLLLLMFMTTACGDNSTSEPTYAPQNETTAGDPERGRDIWGTGGAVIAKPGCVYCHSIDGSEQTDDFTVLAPSLLGISQQAGDRIPGMSAEEYLRESILSPSTFIVEGYENIMQVRELGKQAHVPLWAGGSRSSGSTQWQNYTLRVMCNSITLTTWPICTAKSAKHSKTTASTSASGWRTTTTWPTAQ
jgi:hypothetical protein